MAEPIPRARRLAYALGSPGFQITDRIIVAIAIYYYLPPGGTDLVDQVPRQVFFAGLTAFGVASIFGRVVDSLVDPFVGHWSDRSSARLGRRRSFLLVGVLPMCLLPVAAFFPPGEPGSVTNAWWVGGVFGLYFVFFTVYVAPFLALIPELAWTQESRVRMATLLALVSFPIMGVFGFAWTLGLDIGRAQGLSGEQAIRWVVGVSSGVAILLCLAPVLAVDEKRFARGVRSEIPFRQAVLRTLRNKPFLVYLLAQLLFILGINLLQPALPYYATVVLGRSEGFAAQLGGAIGLAITLSFPLVNRLARRIGAKHTLIGCIVLFSLASALLGLLRPDVPGGPNDRFNLILLFGVLIASGPPVAGFLVVPHVLISQLIDRDEVATGFNRAAMFFGMQGLMTKWMYGVSTAVLAFLFARFGNSPEMPGGVLLIGPVVGASCLLSVLLYAFYPEKRVLAETAARRRD